MTLTTNRLTAAAQGGRLSLAVEAVQGRVTASTLRRTLAGPVVRYGDVGRTSAGPLVVAPGSLVFPDELARVKLTREHERDNARGHLVEVVDDPVPGGTLRAALKVSDGPEGDAALVEAGDKTRDGFSFDVVDAVIDESTDPPTLTSALVIAIGQVGIPAFDDMRIDTIAASQNTTPPRKGSTMLTDAQRARLRELLAKTDRTEAEQAEFTILQAAAVDEATAPEEGENVATEGQGEGEGEGSGEAVTASRPRAATIPAVPSGTHRPATRTTPRGSALDRMVRGVVAALGSGGGVREVSAALSDVTQSGVGSDVEAPAWSGELWSGLAYDPEFTPLLASGDLTNYEGKGWRWVTKPVMADYAGDKAAIPSAALDTEPATYEAARMAVGHDIDRKFYDFPNEANAAFLRSYVEAARESWAVRLDAKVEAWIIANAVDVGVEAPDAPNMFKALAMVFRQVKRNKAGRASFAIISDGDYDNLIDFTNDDVPAFLTLFGISPESFTSSANVPDGTVIGGARQAATVRTLPGSPIRVSAQHLANGGIDEAFFGYWAIEQHHESAIVKATFGA